MRPRPEDWKFDLDTALDAVVQLRSNIPDDAFTAPLLGTERGGNGVVIREGLVLTVGYLITEASTIWLTTNKGTVAGAFPLAYDQNTGFGLVQPLTKLNVRPIEIGSAAACRVGENVVLASHGGPAHALKASIFAKREFAGYWEYVLDEAVITSPAHPRWSGAALLDPRGRLIGIGSLLVQVEADGREAQANMFVPIDILEPLLDRLAHPSRSAGPARPWLGMYTQEANGSIVVIGTAHDGPADKAGVQQGDLVLGVATTRVRRLGEFFKLIWRQGPAGVEVPLSIARDGDVLRISVKSADRNDFLKKPHLH
jgi:S1-C subfamily serine protease